MDDHYINYFMEIARRKNLSKAATYLFVTQSSLSQFLNKEEHDLGVKLFIRDKKGLKLTYAGELYKKACEEMLESKNRLYHALADIEESKTGVTKIGITPQWGGMTFAKILPEFQKAYPQASLKLYENTARPLMEAISDNSIDLALIALNDEEPYEFPHISVRQEELFLAVPRTFVQPEDVPKEAEETVPTINLDRFHHCPFIISRERTVIRDITNDMFRTAGFIPKISCEINNHLASLEMVSSGLGITIVPKCYMLPYDNIQYFSIAPHWYWNISIVKRRSYTLSQSDQFLINLLKKHYQDN